jgi:hypothetical protein
MIKGLSFCRDPSLQSLVRSSHQTSRERSGHLSSGRSSDKRSGLLRGAVVLGREMVCPIVGSPERTDAPPLKEGLAFCRDPSFQSLVKASHKSTLKRSVHLSHSRIGRASHDKRSVLLSRFVVFFAGSVRSPEVSQEVWPFADWPFAGIRRFCRGFAPLTRGLGICRPLLDSRSGSIYGTGRDSKAAVHLQGPGGTCVAAGRAGG